MTHPQLFASPWALIDSSQYPEHQAAYLRCERILDVLSKVQKEAKNPINVMGLSFSTGELFGTQQKHVNAPKSRSVRDPSVLIALIF